MPMTLPQLRTLATKAVLRQAKEGYILRHALSKPWVASTQLDELAWTDYKQLFFNLEKLEVTLDNSGTETKDRQIAHLAAVCHEVLHVLWLHQWRSRGKQHDAWRTACEWSINYELVQLLGRSWISDLDVMFPSSEVLGMLHQHNLPPTTDGFYTLLTEHMPEPPPSSKACSFCDHHPPTNEAEPTEQILRNLRHLPESPERMEVLRHLAAAPAPTQKIPWDLLLLGGLEDAVSQEQSWQRPARRAELLPSWRPEKLLSFVWILDVSPSINDEMKRSFMHTLQAGINLYQDAEHRVICFAEGILEDFRVTPNLDLGTRDIPEGYGTCLEEVWEVLERDTPDYALVLTDLELQAVPRPTHTQIVWGIVGEHRTFDPDYGIKVVLR